MARIVVVGGEVTDLLIGPRSRGPASFRLLHLIYHHTRFTGV
jgi:hypothetical protein